MKMISEWTRHYGNYALQVLVALMCLCMVDGKGGGRGGGGSRGFGGGGSRYSGSSGSRNSYYIVVKSYFCASYVKTLLWYFQKEVLENIFYMI